MNFILTSKTAKQGIRHILVGAAADVADIIFFQLFFILLAQDIISKTVSFMVAVAIKYAGNKYWAFEKPEKDGIKKEMAWFFGVTIIGLLINVASFSFFVRINTYFDPGLWRLASVVFAMAVTAIWNFLTYKFIVFKK